MIYSNSPRKVELGRLTANVLCAALSDRHLVQDEIASIQQIGPYLLALGGGSLGWRTLKDSKYRDIEIGHELHQAYRLHSLQAAVHERELGLLFTYLNQHNFTALLGKGWAIARHYPEAGLRPYGDFDLYVRPAEFDRLQVGLAEQNWNVDLHHAVPEMPDRDFEALLEHSQLATCQGASIRLFSPEDHLRLLCLHFLREGALRPLWLFDLAIALKTLPTDFDWQYLLSGEARRSDMVLCALGLAHELLGAPIAGTPVEKRAKNLPRWLLREVLREWGAGKVTHGRRRPVASLWREPRALGAALLERWPNQIEASYRATAPFNNFPRWPFQLWECVQRLLGFAWQTPKLWRNEPVVMK